MKKTKVLALALAAGITFMGAGYAAWTDGIEATTTVSTGNMEVKIESPRSDVFIRVANQTGNSTQWKRVDENNDYGIGFDKDIDEGDGKNITFAFDKAIPGVDLTTDFTIANKGSVPVKFKDININVAAYKVNADGSRGAALDLNDSEIYDKMQVTGDFYLYSSKNDNYKEHISLERQSVSDFVASFRDAFKGKEIKPNGFITTETYEEDKLHGGFGFMLTTEFGTSKDANGNVIIGDNLGQNEGIEFVMNFDFVQSNLYTEN